jgi:hypothetical protein
VTFIFNLPTTIKQLELGSRRNPKLRKLCSEAITSGWIPEASDFRKKVQQIKSFDKHIGEYLSVCLSYEREGYDAYVSRRVRVLQKLSKLGFRPAIDALKVDRLWETECV